MYLTTKTNPIIPQRLKPQKQQRNPSIKTQKATQVYPSSSATPS